MVRKRGKYDIERKEGKNKRKKKKKKEKKKKQIQSGKKQRE